MIAPNASLNVKIEQDLPKICLVTCSYNQAEFLEATLQSVLNQDYSNLAYSVIDGASKDGSPSIIARYADKLSYWVSERDAGQTSALIKGFDATDGEIMGWLCSDDLLLPNSLHTVGMFFRDNPDANVMFGDAVWIDRSGGFIRPKKEMPFSRFVLLMEN